MELDDRITPCALRAGECHVLAFRAEGKAGLDLFKYGLGFPSRPPLAWLESAGPSGRRALVKFLAHHKVYPYARRGLELIASGGGGPGASDGTEAAALACQIDERWPWARRAGEVADERLRAIVEALRGYAGPVMLLKGASYRVLLDFDPLRPQNDVDVCVPGLDDMWRLTRFLLERGYEFSAAQGSWIQGFTGVGGRAEVHGSVALERKEPLPPAKPPRLDIRTGTVSVGLLAMLRFPIWRRAAAARFCDMDFLVPSPEDCLLVSIAHQYNHGHFLLRDALDVARLLGAYGDRMDVAYVLHWARREQLGRALSMVLSCAVELQQRATGTSPLVAAMGIVGTLGAAAAMAAGGSALSGAGLLAGGLVPPGGFEDQCLAAATGWAHRHKNGAAALLTTIYTYNHERAERGRARAVLAALRNLAKVGWLSLHARARLGRLICRLLGPLAALRPAAGALRPSDQVTLCWVEDEPPSQAVIDAAAGAPGARPLGAASVLVRSGRAEALVTAAGWFIPVHGPFFSGTVVNRGLALKERLEQDGG
jgi:hypothetical protein